MSRSTADWQLRLEGDAWLLRGAAAAQRLAHEGAPDKALAQLQGGGEMRGGRLHVVLGDGWLRYLVLNWPRGVRRGEERRAFMAHRFREVHGVAEPDWTLALDRDVVDFPALACAVPAALLEAVREFARVRGLRLAGVTGDFADAFNRLQGRFDEPEGCFGALALARAGRLTVGLWRDGAWQAVRSQPLGGGEAGLGAMLEAWCAGRTPAAQAGVLYAAGHAFALPAGWRQVPLEAA